MLAAKTDRGWSWTTQLTCKKASFNWLGSRGLPVDLARLIMGSKWASQKVLFAW